MKRTTFVCSLQWNGLGVGKRVGRPRTERLSEAMPPKKKAKEEKGAKVTDSGEDAGMSWIRGVGCGRARCVAAPNE